MGSSVEQTNFYAGGFLYNPETRSVLLQLRDDKTPIHPNQWGFFGGKSEKNESPKECFIRELEEELGIKIQNGDIKHLCDYLNIDRNIWRHIFYVESKLNKSKMTLNEGAGFDWIPLDKLSAYDLTEKTKQDLKKFIRLNTKI